MSEQGKNRSHSLISRLVAMTACVALLVVGVTWWLAGFSLFVGIATAVALAGLFGLVVVESGGGIVEMLSGLLELIRRGTEQFIRGHLLDLFGIRMNSRWRSQRNHSRGD